MIHVYDSSYLPAARKNLARMLDYLVNDVGYQLEKVWQWFLMSSVSFRFEQGDSKVLVGVSGIELACMVLEETGEPIPKEKPQYMLERSAEYWTGWALAYYQWETGLSFEEIEKVVPIVQICHMYYPYHEMDIRQFVDQMNILMQASNKNTNLKILRTLVGLSQSELAKFSQVSVRTIQEYEQRKKDINKAQAMTLLRMARVLHCSIEDLIEKVPV